MDVLAHSLWAGLAYRGINARRKAKERFSLWWAAFWGVFPDLFSFSIPFVWMLWLIIFRGFNLGQIPRPENMEPIVNHLPVFQIANSLYNVSHSLIVFLIVFGIVCLIFKKPKWVMGGWLVHILLDIPSHSYQFYPTPIFWPLSNWKFNGMSWGNPWFMLVNYSALIILYLVVYFRGRERKSS